MVILGNAAAGAWALTAHWVERARTRVLWWFTAAAQVAVVVQVILGVEMVARENIEAKDFHMFYGFVAMIAVALIYSYRQQLRDRLYLLYGLGGFFVMGLGIRALQVNR